MRNLLLLLLGLLLIGLLSYYCFKNKTEIIENHLLSSAEEIYSEKPLDEVVVTIKGEELNTTRILVLTGRVDSIEERNSAEKIAQNINGVYAVENNLRVKKELITEDEALRAEVIAPKLTISKLATNIKEEETEKIKPTLENLVPSVRLEQPVIEKATSCEENLNAKLIKEKIHFEYNKALIKEDSYTLLNELGKIVKTCSKGIVHIEGHTDSQGTKKYNQWLSQKRANSVRAYFIKYGIKKVNLKALGHGETRPIATNKTEAGKKLNRRIEFKIKGVEQ